MIELLRRGVREGFVRCPECAGPMTSRVGYGRNLWFAGGPDTAGGSYRAGRGFVALAAAIFGCGRPTAVFLACLLFGAADAVAIQFQAIGVPPYFALMAPYVVTTVVLWLVSRP